MMKENNEVNKLICGDNIDELAKLPRESIHLVYADPPFFSHKHYEVIWGDEAEVRSFEDRWEGGIEHYIGWMKPRIQLVWEALKSTGSFYLHCDWRATAHLRILLDEVFGKENFRNEIIWCFNVGGKSRDLWARKHHTIYFYSKSKKWVFNKESAGAQRETGTKSLGGIIGVDKKGRKYQDKLVKATGKYYRYYLDSPKIREDWWTDINSIQSQSSERMGYPTQKPRALLRRIIATSSSKGDWILDPFCGCGTAVAAAQELGRRWIGIDISPTAIEVEKESLSRMGLVEGKDYAVSGMPATVADLKKLKHFEFQNWIVNEMRARHSRKKVGDMGLDGYIMKDMFHSGAGIQVKQSEDVGRNVVDNFEAALGRAKYDKGFIVAFSFTRGAYEEVARVQNKQRLEIRLITVEDLLSKKAVLE